MAAEGGIASKSFHKTEGNAEHFISVTAPGDLSFRDQIDLVRRRYAEARDGLGLAPGPASGSTTSALSRTGAA